MLIKITTAIILASLIGCGSVEKQREPGTVVIIGDSMAAGVHLSAGEVVTTNWWSTLPATSIVNKGLSGAPISAVPLPQSYYDTAIVYMGFNNLKQPDQTVHGIVAEYQLLLSKISAGRIICAGIPFIEHEKSDPWYPAGAWITRERIQSVNNGIREICPLFVDASDVATVDGVHPDYGLIIGRVSHALIN